ncbi:MFS transporter, partial [Stenotrophomonas sp. SrG]|uniref:MFS transporter n=1 Tax=Stenotrophomonas sp. SrG TaxID=3414430 RepID=UPI003CF371BF
QEQVTIHGHAPRLGELWKSPSLANTQEQRARGGRAAVSKCVIARPLGAGVVGHVGDRVGRKATLVASLLTMGIATFLIGCLPTYDDIGWWAALLLLFLRLAQGFALGGEWSGAALVATENAPAGKRAWYGTFPQLGAPLGFIIANSVF